jgi:hypothetical protein
VVKEKNGELKKKVGTNRQVFYEIRLLHVFNEEIKNTLKDP